jgi:WD40 repeat protein
MAAQSFEGASCEKTSSPSSGWQKLPNAHIFAVKGPHLLKCRRDGKPKELMAEVTTFMGRARGTLFSILAAALSGALLSTAAQGQSSPDPRPMLRIEPGMHTVNIKRIGVDANCTLMVTGADDKTARLWALPPGGRGKAELVRTFRPPIGEGNGGKVYTTTISPDGKWVAVAGWDAHYDADNTNSIYIYETSTGRLLTRVGEISNVILHLAVSPDGSRLAAALWGGLGVRIWNTNDWSLLAEDGNYGGKDSYGAIFDAANRLYTVAYDGQLRRYGANGNLETKSPTPSGAQPYSVAVNPGGSKIAVGYGDNPAVDVFDTRTLKKLYAADTANIGKGSFFGVAWSSDGQTLHAGKGRWQPFSVFTWGNEGRGRRQEAVLSHNTVMHLLPCGNNLAVSAADPAFGLITTNGAKLVWQEGVTADVRNARRDTPAVSANGKVVQFGLMEDGADPVAVDIAAFRLSDAMDVEQDLTPPSATGLNVTNWKNDYGPKLNGNPLPLQNMEASRSVAVAPDSSRFALGADWSLQLFDANGAKLWKKEVPGGAWGVNITPDGKLVVASYADGTIRWHRISDGKELLALFVHSRDRRFVAWTPKGYYAASPGAEELIGWHVNRDWSHAPDFFPAARFRERFNRPDIVKRVLVDLDESKAIAEANRVAGSKPAEEIGKKLPPVITILSPGEGFSEGSVTLRYALRSPSGAAVSEVVALIDGRPLPGGKFRGPPNVSANADAETTLTLTGLPQRDIALSLVANAGGLESTPSTVRLKYEGAKQPTPQQTQAASHVSLYALVVGVGKFKEAKIDPLAWAGKDARDFASALQAQQGKLYRKVEVKLLADEDADSGSILDGLTWLQRQVSQGDVGVVFLAGHGVTAPSGDYYYIPYNARVETIAGVTLPTRGSSVPDTEISHTLKQLAGNALFFFDTCHSGKATGVSFRGALDYNKLINEIAGSANAVVLASSTGSELSMESAEWEHGAFTKALLEGINGAADVLPKDGIVTVDELNLYVKERVKELTGGLQHPVDLKPKEARNVPFAMP